MIISLFHSSIRLGFDVGKIKTRTQQIVHSPVNAGWNDSLRSKEDVKLFVCIKCVLEKKPFIDSKREHRLNTLVCPHGFARSKWVLSEYWRCFHQRKRLPLFLWFTFRCETENLDRFESKGGHPWQAKRHSVWDEGLAEKETQNYNWAGNALRHMTQHQEWRTMVSCLFLTHCHLLWKSLFRERGNYY